MEKSGIGKAVIIAICFTTLLLYGSCTRPSPGEGKTLRELADGRSFLVGFAAVNNFWRLPDAAKYIEIAAREFNIITPENQFKWDSIHPGRETYNFDSSDRHVDFGLANRMKVHGHTLVWHNQNPGWLSRGTWTKKELDAVLKEHIDTVVGRYKARVAIWDVVNEAFEENGSYRSSGSVWYTTIGPEYIEKAFAYTAAADPAAVLIYNDYNIEEINPKSDAVYAMAIELLEKGVPIHGIGFQMHLTASGLNDKSFSDNMTRFAALGLDLYVTEMDVRMPEPFSSASEKKQAEVYRKVMNACLSQPACKALQTWGFTDRFSWIPSFFNGYGAALIYDKEYKEKSAYIALREELATE